MGTKTLAAFGVISVAGMIGLALAVILGFEKADTSLLVISAIAMFVAPVGVVLHFLFTKELTPGDRRLWLRAFTGRRGLDALSVYLSATDRRAAVVQLRERTD